MARPSRRARLAPIFIGLALSCATQAFAQMNGGVADTAAAQISALLADKESRTPAQRKIDSNLIYASRMNRDLPAAPGVPTLQTGVNILPGDRVVVDISAYVSDALLDSLEKLGATIINGQIGWRNVRAEVALADLESIAGRPDVIFINRQQDSSNNPAAKPPALLKAVSLKAVSLKAVSPSLLKKLKPSFAARAAIVRAKVNAALKAQRARKPQAVQTINTSEGRTTHRAAQVVTSLGFTGAGVTIGVISNGVQSLASIQASGDLGPVTVLPGQAGSGDEGTAMLEIVHDLAPGARLFFATANPTISQFAQNIKDLRTAGCDIIVDDVTYFAESPFQRGQAATVASTTNGGIVTEAVRVVTSAGALYFSSAGNEGNVDDNTAGTYEGDFVDGGAVAAPVTGTGNFHQFAVGQNYDVLNAPGALVNLYWSDPLGGSANDYDLFVLNSAGSAVVTSSTNVQNGTQDPYERCPLNPAAGSRIVIVRRTGAASRFVRISTFRGSLSISSPGDTYGHNATPVPFGFTVAATPAAAAFGPGYPTGPFPSPFNSGNTSELFTSDGPRRIFFNNDSTAITPGNFSSSGGTLLQKPDFTAADGVSCATPGFNPFFGTSAAAPHAAAIAALIKSTSPALTQTQIQTALTSTAIDIEGMGVDRDTGAGILDALAAVTSTGAVAQAAPLVGTVTLTEVSGNGNGFVEPGECGGLVVQLINGNAAVAATSVSATLSTSTPGVTITTPTVSYPTIVASGTAVNPTPFQFSVLNTAPCPLFIDFTLTVSFSGASAPVVLTFKVRAGVPAPTSTTTLDTTAPASVAGVYTATTGTQTGRLNRDGTFSDCGAPKTPPSLVTAVGARQYDAYTFTNSSGSTICAKVTLTQTSGSSFALYSAAYSTFNPANPAANYLGDRGTSGNLDEPVTYGFNVASGASFTVVVHEVNPGAGIGANYTLTVDGLCLPFMTYTGTGCGATPAGKDFFTVAPCRVLDTRRPDGAYGGPAFSANTSRTFTIRNQCGVPNTATAIAANVTITNPTADGYTIVWPAGVTMPLASTSNYTIGQTRANNAIAILNGSGDLSIFAGLPAGTGQVDIILDVFGYFQ